MCLLKYVPADYRLELVSAAQRRQLMGHTNDNTFQSYISSLIGIDAQSIVHGRAQRIDLVSNHSSMMFKRNLLAPMPPGSRLTDVPSQGRDSDLDLDVLPAQRRQKSKQAFQEERSAFFEGDSINVKVISTDATRSPSRYLVALLKFEVDRQKVATLMYPDIERDDDDDAMPKPSAPEGGEAGTSVPLKDIVQPLSNIANAQRVHYMYRRAETLESGCCSFCKHKLNK
jgi:hypothetical protein